MNFKNIKKNYKKIIIVCLIIFIFSYKISENFTTTQALDAVKSTEAKVNNMAIKADKNYLDLKSKIRLSNKWTGYPDKVKDQAEIANDTGTYKALMIAGNKSAGGVRSVKIYDDVRVHRNITSDTGNIKGKKICIGGTCIDENILKRLNKVQAKPTKKGCYLYTEKPCSRQHGDAPPTHLWFRDNHHHASSDKNRCKQRAKDFNSWCGNNDFQYHFN